MTNERLRDAMLGSGLTPGTLGEQIGVDPKTVERWITQDRTPYARHRLRVSELVHEREGYLWPHAISPERAEAASRGELVELHPHRSLIHPDEFKRLFGDAETYIDILVYAGLFLPEHNPHLIDLLRDKGADGVRVRVLVGDPNSRAVMVRGGDEGIGDAVATKVQNSITLLKKQLAGANGVVVRTHGTTLYTSIYRGDDDMIANPHVYGLPAAQAPAMHLRRLTAGGLFDTYATMYDRVWDEAQPAWS
ncbi:XRE family transcriptional regulator [Nocardioides marmorisolisilvae]|uniref:XRE family transcriptional regulator n=1 Tax=Nocardioides marmorisolisilvae TaxID=1542737 RepID=A0A3N0DQM3_9ACTN|nr:XRE family transcriptional regulator [Nocardioides marmorisolisilvae]RNL77643.1 XRE family transcriptional regulator [Nocardioides marmorisolisilvae]